VIENNKVLKVLAKSDSTIIQLKSEVTGLKKDMRNLSSANVIGSTTTITTQGDLRDSMAVLHDTLKVLYQKLDKVTPWMKKHIEIVNGKLTEKEKIYDTIMVAAYLEKRWFLGKGHLKVEAFSRNPDSKVVIDKSIIVKRNK
jgi:hypothetical protein